MLREAQADVMRLVACGDEHWQAFNTPAFLGGIRDCKLKIEAFRESSDFWKAWTVL